MTVGSIQFHHKNLLRDSSLLACFNVVMKGTNGGCLMGQCTENERLFFYCCSNNIHIQNVPDYDVTYGKPYLTLAN